MFLSFWNSWYQFLTVHENFAVFIPNSLTWFTADLQHASQFFKLSILSLACIWAKASTIIFCWTIYLWCLLISSSISSPSILVLLTTSTYPFGDSCVTINSFIWLLTASSVFFQTKQGWIIILLQLNPSMLADDEQGGRDWQWLADDEQVSGGTAEVGCCTDTSDAMSPSFLFFLWGGISGILSIIDGGK